MTVELTGFPPFLPELLAAGIEVTIRMDEQSVQGIHYDLNLQSKSYMHLYKALDGWHVAMRYGEDVKIDTWLNLIFAAQHGMHGRDYINPNWAALIAKELL